MSQPSPTNKVCYCGSGINYTLCCQPVLADHASAITAEQLMRSRFSAFCTGNIDYLIASHHPSKRTANDREELADTIEHCQWLKLNIENASLGSKADNHGEVTFSAAYTLDDELFLLTETSQFVKEDNHWFYLDGDAIRQSARQTLGRNDSCWCGTGNKFKRCHGR